MRYRIIIEKISDTRYVAYSPVISSLQINGESANEVLEAVRQKLVCCVHDTEAQFEIVMEGTGHDQGMNNQFRGTAQ
jgi:hypothetical protein